MNKIEIKRIIITVLFAVVLFYFWLPAINLTSPEFYIYILFIISCYLVTSVYSLKEPQIIFKKARKLPKKITYLSVSFISIITLIILVNLVCSPIFNSSSWSKRITVSEDTSFTDDIKEVDFNQVPTFR